MSVNCVYCGEDNKFNSEHMFPAGLGGDDNSFLLTDCVCKKCNDYFSTLEVELSRKTPSALARLIHQTSGRDRGAKTSEPIMQVENSYIIDTDGTLLETKISAKMKTTLVPQVHIKGKVINFTATDPDELEEFLLQLKKTLNEKIVHIIEKTSGAEGNGFFVRMVSLDGPAMTFGETFAPEKPPKNSIWIKEGVERTKRAVDNSLTYLTPRFYHHNGKSITYKSGDSSKILEDLAKVRQFVNRRDETVSFTDTTIDQPLVSVEMGFDYRKVTQAFAKIGMNFIIYLAGAKYASDLGFLNIKTKIRQGTSDIKVNALDSSDPFYQTLSSLPENTHCMALHNFPQAECRSAFFFHLKLYGGVTVEVILSENAPTPPWGAETKFALIHFNEHRIEILGEREFFSYHASTAPE
ncbi:hypothetical protein [Pseudomonas sp. 8 R 14]|nr:hypothetical protein [Pseudomonas sp. 8 R 14]